MKKFILGLEINIEVFYKLPLSIWVWVAQNRTFDIFAISLKKLGK